MTDITQLDRDSAARLNSFIGINTQETLEHVREAMFDLGYLCNLGDKNNMPPRQAGIYRFTNIMCTALEFEISQLQKESGHE